VALRHGGIRMTKNVGRVGKLRYRRRADVWCRGWHRRSPDGDSPALAQAPVADAHMLELQRRVGAGDRGIGRPVAEHQL